MVAVVAFCVSGIFLLILVPDPSRSAVAASSAVSGAPMTAAIADLADEPATLPAAVQNLADDGGGDGADGLDANPEFGRGSYGPLGGAGAPPRRFARHLPAERDGGTHFVAVDDVVAIHANAHHYIFNGSDKLFCPLAIGDVELRLDGSRFLRIHRSHIDNIERVIGHKRSGDNEVVSEMDAAHDYPVKLRLAAPEHLVDLRAIGDLKGIRAEGGDIVIGAMTTQHEVIGSELLAGKLPILRETSLLHRRSAGTLCRDPGRQCRQWRSRQRHAGG